MKQIYSVFIFCTLLVCNELYSQTTISLGTRTGAASTNVLIATGTTTNRYSRTLSIYNPHEILAAGGAAGVISSLGWEKNGPGEYQFGDAYIRILLKHHTDSLWAAVPSWDVEVANATEVFTSSTFSLPTGTGWKTFPFTNNFTWNGVDNLVVMVEWYRPSTPTGDISWGRSTDASRNAARVGSTSLSALVMLINVNRPILQLTINSQPVSITSVNVATLGAVPALINTTGGTLQLTSTVLPANANQNVNWSIIPVTGAASISTAGLVSAITNGNVWAKATSVQDITKSDSISISITNQETKLEDLSNYFNYAIFPNPFNEQTNINFSIDNNETISVQVFDATGRLVETLYNGYKQQGTYTLTWDATNVAPGIYFCKISINKAQRVIKLVKKP